MEDHLDRHAFQVEHTPSMYLLLEGVYDQQLVRKMRGGGLQMVVAADNGQAERYLAAGMRELKIQHAESLLEDVRGEVSAILEGGDIDVNGRPATRTGQCHSTPVGGDLDDAEDGRAVMVGENLAQYLVRQAVNCHRVTRKKSS